MLFRSSKKNKENYRRGLTNFLIKSIIIVFSISLIREINLLQRYRFIGDFNKLIKEVSK